MQKNAQNEGVGVGAQANPAVTSGHCLGQKVALQNMSQEVQILKLCAAEKIFFQPLLLEDHAN